MTTQPIPNVTSADVERVVRREFPADRIGEVLSTLREYGTQSWQRDPDRVRLAALKLAAGNVARLRDQIESAKYDYRDVLAAAEYPGYCQRVFWPGLLSPQEEQQVIEADWKQYQDWLAR